jgi:hypothetical protein
LAARSSTGRQRPTSNARAHPGCTDGAAVAAMPGQGPAELVMTSPDRAVLRSGNFRRRAFDPAAKVAGLADLRALRRRPWCPRCPHGRGARSTRFCGVCGMVRAPGSVRTLDADGSRV